MKDLKVGDKVYTYCAYLSPDEGFVVKSIKKQKTLAIVTIDWNVLGKHKDVICYGHVSGELLVYNGAATTSALRRKQRDGLYGMKLRRSEELSNRLYRF